MESNGLDLRHLRVFFEVAKAGGVGRAGSALGVGQPAVSKAMAAFEKELGVVLLERHKRGTSLTPAGARVFEIATRIFADVAEVRAVAESERDSLRGDLVVAANEHVVTHLLPSVVAGLRAAHPELVPRLHSGPADLLLREIATGRAELGLFFKVPERANVDRTVLARVPCRLVAARGMGRRADVLESFVGSREIDDGQNRAFPTLDMLRAKRPRTRITMSSNNLEAHKALVLCGAGISILPLFVVERELAAGELEIVHPEWVYPAALELVTRRGKVLSRAAHALVAGLRKALTRWR